MASLDEAQQALAALAGRLDAADPAARRKAPFDRTLSCTLPDLGVTFGAHLHEGQLTDIQAVDSPNAQVRLTMSSDDLVALVAGELNLAGAWASGRVKVDASVFDLLKLRSVF